MPAISEITDQQPITRLKGTHKMVLDDLDDDLTKKVDVSSIQTDPGYQVYNVKAYGAVMDGASHPLSAVYGTLGAAQVDYPSAVSLADEFDQVAIEKAVASFPDYGGTLCLPPGNARITRTWNIGDGSNTNVSTRRGQRIVGQGPGAGHNEITPLMTGTRISWYGADGGKMVHVKGPTGGVEIKGIFFDPQPGGTGNRAATAVHWAHPIHCRFEDCITVAYGGEGYIIEAYGYPTDATYGCAQGATGNTWIDIRAYAGTANSIGLRVGALHNEPVGTGPVEFDVNSNVFIGCHFRTVSDVVGSVGVQLSFCDNNAFYSLWTDGEVGIRIAPPSSASISGGVVQSPIPVTSGGIDYTTPPTITFKGGGGAGAAATAVMGVGWAGITAQGSGYADGVYALGFSGGGGTGAAGTYTVTGGQVVFPLVITNPGTGYTSQPAVSFPSGGGTGAAATAFLKVVSINLTNGGAEYEYRPSLIFSGGGGTGAMASASYWPQSNTFYGSAVAGKIPYLEEDGWTGTPDIGNVFIGWQTGDLEAVPSPQALSFQGFTYGGLTLGNWRHANTYNNAPKDLVATPSTASGSVVAGTYYFMVTAYDGQGYSLPSADIKAILSATGKIILQWASVIGAISYRIYRGTVAGRNGKTLFFTSTDTYYEWTTDAGATTVTAALLPPIAPETASYKFSKDGSFHHGKMGWNTSSPVCGFEILGGAFQITKIPEAIAPLITNVGTAGGTTYDYYAVMEDAAGRRTLSSPVGRTTTGHATLSATNYNRIEVTPVKGIRRIYVLKKNTTPPVPGTAETILLKTIVIGTDPTFVFDRGAALDPLTTFTNAARNDTADLKSEGRITGASVSSLAASAAAQTLTANATTYITGSDLAVPSSGFAINQVYEWDMDVSKTAAGTAVKSFAIKIGTAGAVADTTVLTLALPAGTAVTDQGTVRIRLVIRGPLGASCLAYGSCLISHGLPITGLMTSHAAAPAGITSTFNSATAGLRVGIAFVAGTAEVWTIQNIVAKGPG